MVEHRLKIVLVEPEIPQNTGNIARLCAAAGAELHLVRPLGFFLTDRHFKRAGMDYLSRVAMTVHDNLPALLATVSAAGGRVWITSGFGTRPHWDAQFAAGDWILFGRESAGLPEDLRRRFAETEVVIPMLHGERGINLSTSAGIVLYEAIRQIAAAKL